MNSSDSMPLRAASIVVPLALAAALPSRQRPPAALPATVAAPQAPAAGGTDYRVDSHPARLHRSGESWPTAAGRVLNTGVASLRMCLARNVRRRCS